MHAGAGRVVERGDGVADADALGDLRGVEQLVATGEPERLQRLVGALDRRLAGARRAPAAARRRAAHCASIPSSAITRSISSTVSIIAPEDGARGLRAVALAQHAGGDREPGIAPPAVAARGAEAGDLPLDDRDAQRRVAAQEVVGRPEPGVPGAHDRDVDVDRAVESRPRRQIVAARLQPERVARVVFQTADLRWLSAIGYRLSAVSG